MLRWKMLFARLWGCPRRFYPRPHEARRRARPVSVTAVCVECGAPFEVAARWVVFSKPHGFIEGVRGMCEKGHYQNCTIAELEARAEKGGVK